MRVVVIGRFYREAFALHIAETFETMGHEVCRYDPGFSHGVGGGVVRQGLRRAAILGYEIGGRISAIRRRRGRRLLNSVSEHVPDLILVCYDLLWPDEVAEIKANTKAPAVLWYPDAIANFGRSMFLNAPYDALFFKDPYIVQVFRRVLRTPVHYLPEAFNPARHRLPDEKADHLTRYRCDVTTAGNVHAYRVAVFAQLEEFDVKIWGNPPPFWLRAGPVGRMFQGKYVANEEKAMAFRGAKIVLNTLYPAEIWGVNVRTFEAAGIGAFQIVDWRPGLAQLFEDGRELVSFSGIADLKSKIRYYLSRPDERVAIAEAGMRRAFSEHTYEHRLSLLLKTLAGQVEGFPLPSVTNSWRIGSRKEV